MVATKNMGISGNKSQLYEFSHLAPLPVMRGAGGGESVFLLFTATGVLCLQGGEGCRGPPRGQAALPGPHWRGSRCAQGGAA